MAISTLQAAKTICNLSNWTISNLPLQKLLYLSHMMYLGEYNILLITGQFQAWDLGPVEVSLYHKVKAYGNNPVVNIFLCDDLNIQCNEFKTIKSTYEALKDAPIGELVAITHWEKGAWAKNYKPNIHGIVIPDEDILNEYRARAEQIKNSP